MVSQELISSLLEKKKKLDSASSYLYEWNNWYKGYVPSFHRYYIYNGKEKNYMTRFSMKMAKKSCEDWASLLMNEKVQIGVKNQDLLNQVLMDIDFYNKTNKSVEFAFALSMAGITVELENVELMIDEEKPEEPADIVITQETKIKYAVYSANKIIPITYENGEVTECAFVQENTDNTKLTIHEKDINGKYRVTVCKVAKATRIINESFSFVVDVPLFAIVHPQLVNNLEIDSAKPISVFANSIDTLKAIDIMFDSYANEFNLGRKRLFVSADMSKVNKDTGEIQRSFDPRDVVIHMLPPAVEANGSQKPIIQEINGALRVAEHSQAIQDLLNFYSSQVGLGVDYYRFEKGRVMTATQVISEKSDTFRNLKKHEGVFEKALFTIIKAIQYAYNELTLEENKFSDIDKIAVAFDDSIIEDKNTEKTNDQKDVQFGAMSLVAYRMKWYGEDEEKAIQKVKEIYGDADLLKRLTNFAPFLSQGILTPKQFVKVVYINLTEAEQNSLAEEISQNLKSGAEVFSDGDLLALKQPIQN